MRLNENYTAKDWARLALTLGVWYFALDSKEPLMAVGAFVLTVAYLSDQDRAKGPILLD